MSSVSEFAQLTPPTPQTFSSGCKYQQQSDGIGSVHRGRRFERRSNRGRVRDADDDARAGGTWRARSKKASGSCRTQLCIELFGGTGRLAVGLRELGIPTSHVFEVEHGKHCDLHDCRVVNWLIRQIREGRVGYIHLGTPCVMWSIATRKRARHDRQGWKS